ncbi:MAG: tRNA (5-methylaminomethyl-2-thiouridine)(34)-methyltransferase MnmD [Candidatus Latescibacterota bacterium]|jgi:tRNA U34 5-methylaminomethyl-2-thiouridine-forming methyltransferase MnmC|tara:strand:+ start:4 stop:663 length:660 start_codon:yes stop_codon:yes gene_type:complete
MEIITTADGSHTLASPYADEHYHSKHGALQEGRHVFIQHGVAALAPRSRSEIRILEMGFGTGLNALLTWRYGQEQQRRIFYASIEAQPVPAEVVRMLNYEALVPGAKEIFTQLHRAPWDKAIELTELFCLQKRHAMLEKIELEPHFDIVYYDAFGPSCQPELWTPSIFAKLYASLVNGGFLVTYCAKGQVKRDLRSVGFEVIGLPGPPGKREITKAIKA